MDRIVNTIPQIIADVSNTASDKKVFYWRSKRGVWQGMTWCEFNEAVVNYASHLTSRGIGKGQCVGIMAPTSLQWQIAEMAIWRCGATVVAMDTQASSKDVLRILQTMSVKALIVSAPLPMEIRSHSQWYDIPVFEFSKLATIRPKGEKSVVVGTGCVAPDDAAFIIFTSGTTGEAKAIRYTHAELLLGVRGIYKVLPITESDTVLCWLPLSHLFQQIANLLGMISGVSIFFQEDPRTLMDALSEVRPTIFIGVPRFYEKVHQEILERIEALPARMKRGVMTALDAIGNRNVALKQGIKIHLPKTLFAWGADQIIGRKIRSIFGGKIRIFISGSAPLSKEALCFFDTLGLCILEAYGLSENTIPLAMNRPGEWRIGSVGKPLDGNLIRIEVDGEVSVKGDGLFGGYFSKSKSKTQSVLSHDGYYCTGDYGKFDKDGFLYLNGRKSEIIKLNNGRQVAPVRIESMLEKSPLIEQAMVVGHAQHYLSALIVGADVNVSELEIRMELVGINKNLAHYERIRNFKITERPFSVQNGALTSSLKLKRHVIQCMYRADVEAMASKPMVKELVGMS